MRYLQYRLRGFDGMYLSNNKNYYPLNNYLFKSIHISDNMRQLKVELNEEITYKKYKNEIENYLDDIFFNMITNPIVCLCSPNRYLVHIEDVDDVKAQNEEKSYQHIKVHTGGTDQLVTGADRFYNNIIQTQTAMAKRKVLYARIFQTLLNPIKVIQFLSLYQLLYELLSKDGESRQSYVTDFIKLYKDKYPEIKTDIKSRNLKKSLKKIA